MNRTKLVIYDEVNCKFEGLAPEFRRELYKRNKVFNPANKFIPSVRLGRWDGCEYFFSMGGKTYLNLLPDILEYLIENNVEIDIEDQRTYNREFHFTPITNDYLKDQGIVWPESHQLAGQPVILRDHQTEASNAFFNNLQGIGTLPTSSGKSALTLVLSKKLEKYGRSLIIVPNKDLITQTESYYKMANVDVGVFFGDRKDFFKTHTISTWQSLDLLRQAPMDIGPGIAPVTFNKFIEGVTGVIVDECHGIRGNVLHSMLTNELAKIPVRWALTGTIPKEAHEVIKLKTAIGDQFYKLYTTDLQENGVLSKCDVHIKQLIDTREFSSYSTEYEHLVSYKPRMTYIANQIRTLGESGNVLVLVGRKKTGKLLESLIDGSVFVSGETKSKVRKSHYDEVKTSNSKIIIATTAVAAVGIDIPRLHHLVLVEAGKSYIVSTQAVGRVLRTAIDKDYAEVWDYCSSCKYSKKHLTERKKWYKESGFPIDIEKVIWEK